MFGVRWQQYELWSSGVNLSSLAVTKDEKNDDGSSERPPSVIVKCRSADMVCIHIIDTIQITTCMCVILQFFDGETLILGHYSY